MLHGALILACLLFWPHLTWYALFGVGLGLFYLWSLLLNARHPKKGFQFVFSLIRIVILAYVIVVFARGRLPELTIVMCGLLSYKVVLVVNAVAQVASGLGRPVKAPATQESPPH